MSEMGKTMAFVAAAVVSLAAAFLVDRGADTFDVEQLVGRRLNQFEVEAAKRLTIIKFDSETATTREFEVAEDDGLWSIPSKQNYPADATRQMAEAATCVIDREILRVASNSPGEHGDLGVIDPSSANLDSKSEGVGTRVVMTDVNDKVLTDMIIGKQVKDAAGQRYVRNADQDVVYVVAIDPGKLSTQFDDWIEEDLLKINPLDIRRVNMKDYSIEIRMTIAAGGFQEQVLWDRRGEMTLEYEESDSKWNATELLAYDKKKKELVPYKLADDEQLDDDVLSKLRNGLDDLVIVDVERKPEGLSGDLKAGGSFLDDADAQASLGERGFAPVALVAGGDAEILSSEGELICTLKDGVEYVLRFGDLKMDSDGEAQTNDSDDDSDGDSDGASNDESTQANAGIHRYLFVMARLNEAMIDRPELDELPELPKEDADSEDQPSSETNDETSADETSADGKIADEETDETTESDEQEDERKQLIAARELIEKENQRRLDEYQDKIASTKERVSELNERFGDWYYVIDNKVFNQIHLGRDDVIKKKEAEGAAEESAESRGLPNLPLGGAPAGG